ncbi:IS30 family transposase (plasmid) [Rhodococcus sp. USK10]|uniref:IS30 family transposase n=1 Tax=Rhodococcus sp. USK10 TaxID=2789739 RepID=UPI001C5E88CC|nr:IS30 family transposase [Rhodococcus sp. USK10]QYB00096.1 IS30 family transposase [Rhodococcus sp. USK10]
MGRPPGWAAALTGRAVMRSPGRPPIRRDLERAFWTRIAEGLTSDDAATACGVSGPVGTRWFRQAGGMPPIELAPVSGRYLSFTEREDIALLRAKGMSMRDIADRIGRSPSTISRELRRNAATRNGKLEYRASTAQWKADLAARRPKPAKLAEHDRLREYVQDKLSGVIRADDGTVVSGPDAAWIGRNKPRRGDRRWATAWSPEQISNRLPIDYPDDPTMRISPEAIYQSLYIEGRGGLERELVACLRTGRALRKPRARARKQRTGFITEEVTISARPDEVESRKTPGHWEGDLIIGLTRSAIGTLVERTSRYTTLLHLPRLKGYGTAAMVKNGPALSGYGSESVRDALAATLSPLPEHLRRSVTWDRGKELARHAELTASTGIRVYFCDPYSPWQRGTNENTNGLLRQYFPKGTDLSRYKFRELQAVADALNNRPRKVHGWRTPAEVFAEHVHSSSRHGVATTG